jgi:Cu2+-exporting ATPase
VLHALRAAARRGMVVLDGRTLEALPKVDTVVFDKTGTLTDPVPGVTRIACGAGIGENDALRWAAAAEHRQAHPVALAIRAEAERRWLRTKPPDDIDYAASNGIQASVEGTVTHVGSARYMAMMGIPIPPQAAGFEILAQQAGESAIHVARGGMHVAVIALRITVRAEARGVVAALRARGLRVHIISGDGAAQTEAVARDLGVDTYHAAVLPGEKADIIEGMQQQGRFVCFVGDGINDVVAMRQAEVSMAVVGASSAATAVAGVLLLSGDLRRVLDLFAIADTFARRLRQSALVTTVPGLVAACAIVPLGGGFAGAMLLNQVIFASGLATMVRPWPSTALPPAGRDVVLPGIGDAAV